MSLTIPRRQWPAASGPRDHVEDLWSSIVVQLIRFLHGETFDDLAPLRRFSGVDLGIAPPPVETTILRFRYILGQHELCGQKLDTVNFYLDGKGIRISTGTIVDATLIRASVQRRMQARCAILRCIRPGRDSNGISAPRRISAWIVRRWWFIP